LIDRGQHHYRSNALPWRIKVCFYELDQLSEELDQLSEEFDQLSEELDKRPSFLCIKVISSNRFVQSILLILLEEDNIFLKTPAPAITWGFPLM
jgi:hypothetical protein